MAEPVVSVCTEELAEDPLTPEMRETFGDIDGLGHLEPDWDGEDAPAPDPDTITRTRDLIRELAQVVRARRIPWISPEVAPSRDGGVSLSWYCADRWLLLRLLPLQQGVRLIQGASDDAPNRRDESTHDAVDAAAAFLSGW